MRLNQKGYPAYFCMVNGRFDQIKYLPEISKKTQIETVHTAIFQCYKQVKERYLMAQTFRAAFEKSVPKIKDNLPLLMQEGYARIIFLDKQVILCVMASNPNEFTPFSALIFEGEWLVAMYSCNRDGRAMGWKKNQGETTLTYGDDGDFLQQSLYLMKLNYFIKNCEIETVVVSPGKKTKTEKDKVLNESTEDLTILDARWFTNIVRNEPYGVDGHYRWQPHGTGRKLVKLIWIAGYDKQGYSRKATIESINKDT